MSLTLNAPTPYPPLAASSRSCRMETRGIAILLLNIFPEFSRRQAHMGLFCGGNCNRPYGSRAAQGQSVRSSTPHNSFIAEGHTPNDCSPLHAMKNPRSARLVHQIDNPPTAFGVVTKSGDLVSCISVPASSLSSSLCPQLPTRSTE